MTAGYGHVDSLGVRTYFEAHISSGLRFVTSLVPLNQRAVFTRSNIELPRMVRLWFSNRAQRLPPLM